MSKQQKQRAKRGEPGTDIVSDEGMDPVPAVAEQPERSVRRRVVRNLNLSSSPPISIGMGAFRFMVEVFPCHCVSIFLVQLVKMNGEACYIKFILDFLEAYPDACKEMFRVFGIVTRRDPSTDADVAMPQKKGSPYARRCLVIYAQPNETRSAVGQWLASNLTTFANQSPDFIGTNNKFIYRECNPAGEPNKPVCHWIRYKDCLVLLKKVWGSGGVHLSEVMAEEDAMVEFFGTVENGQRFLANFTEDEWQHLES